MTVEKRKSFWHTLKGVLGAFLLASSVGWIGYAIRGYEDGGIVASLMQRVNTSRLDERATQLNAQKEMQKGYQLRSDERDKQVAFLIKQNEILINFFVSSSKERKAQLEQLKELASRSANAAIEAKSTAVATEKKVDRIASAVEAASAPKASTLHFPFLKGH